MVVREETAHRLCFELVGQKYEVTQPGLPVGRGERMRKSEEKLVSGRFILFVWVSRSFFTRLYMVS